MSKFSKVIAVLCSATMILGSTVTAFATEPTTEAGDGNIIAYSVETVTVPTSVKVSFNPQKWAFKLRSTDSGTVNDQIVSLNYGIHSMASMDKKVTISFAATGTTGTGEAIEFVDTADDALVKDENNANGKAGYGEYKIYLAVAPAAAKVTKSGTTDFAIATGASNVTTDLLADVDMTAATKGLAVFSAGKTNVADSEIAFELGKATYALKSGQNPTFDTDQTALAAMIEPTALGDVVGFTFTGAMNQTADWTKANLSAISIKPTYEFDDIDGTEEELGANGGYNQIATAPAVTTAYASIQNLGGKNMLIVTPTNDSTFATTLAVADITSYKAKYNNGEFVDAKAKVAVSAGKIGVTTADLQSLLGFSGLTTGDKITVEITVSGTNYQAVYTR